MQARDSFAYVTSAYVTSFGIPQPAVPNSKSCGQIKLPSTTSYNQTQAFLQRVWPPFLPLYSALDPASQHGARLRRGISYRRPQAWPFVRRGSANAGGAKSAFSAHCSSAGQGWALWVVICLPEPRWSCYCASLITPEAPSSPDLEIDD